MKGSSPERAAICTRVSTTTQVQGTSLETQLEEGHAYAGERGLSVVGDYVDGGVTGKYRNRPDLDRLMADCRDGLIDVVIVSKHDRFGRSFRHMVALIGELDDLGVEFVSLAERIDNTPSGRFQRNVLLSVAEFERERIVERTAAGVEATARAGWWTGGPPPFGWKLVKDGMHTKAVVDETESTVWHRIAECLIDRRLSTLETARELNGTGMLTRGQKRWTARGVLKAVQATECLSGTWTFRRQVGGGHGQARRPADSPITIPIEPILTPERHEALKSVIEGRKFPRKRRKQDWLLSMLITSPCGRTMRGQHAKTRTPTYFCPGTLAHNGGGGGDCGCKVVHARDLEATVWNLVVGALSRPELLLSLAHDQARGVAAREEVGSEDLAALDRKIARLEKAAGGQLARALAAGVDPKIAAAATGNLSEQIDESRQRRRLVASWAADAAERRSRVDLLADLARRSADALTEGGSPAGRRRVLDALDLRVKVTGWTTCASCSGTGRVKAPGWSCEDCQGMRRKARVEVTGSIPAVGSDEHAEPWPVTFATGS